jgi:hypothetical protein
VDLWGKAKDLIKGNVITKVVDEMWTYLYRNARAFYKWAFTRYVYTSISIKFIV